MFEALIVSTLKNAPQTTPELYDAARKSQPQDCDKVSCTHRNKISDFEWQHQLRREQQYLKKQGIIELRSGRWQLNK
ncbi:MAG TPA: hypothetical protein VIJ01_17520 [Candidatus Angelobacter sp.]